MQMTITGRNIEVTPALREYAGEKMTKIEKYLHKITGVHVILSVEKYRHIAEVTIQAYGLTLRGMEETGDMYSSIDKVMDKIGKQAKKLKDRLTDKNKGIVDEEEVSPPGEAASGHAPKIIHSVPFDPKPMTVDEAAMQFQLKEDLFMVFLNAATDKINVLYRRKDGDLGLIETL